MAGAVAGAALLLAACGSSGGDVQGADPGSQRLHQLAGDPIFAKLPHRAHDAAMKLMPALYRKGDLFTPGSWQGPGVTLIFTSSATPLSVYTFYGEQARDSGWMAVSVGSLHVTDTWRKTYPNGARATMILFTPRPWEPAPGPRVYRLLSGISQPRR